MLKRREILRTLVEFLRLKKESMKTLPSYEHLPWDLIVASLQGELSSEDAGRFRKWLAESAANEEIYAALQRIWSESLADYPVYQEDDAVKAFSLFRWRITKKGIFPTQIAHNKLLVMLKRIFPPRK